MLSAFYLSKAISTENNDFLKIRSRFSDRNIRILHVAIGLCTESAELNDAITNTIFIKNDLDKVNINEEIGDLFWYIAVACDELSLKESDRDKSIKTLEIKDNFEIKTLFISNTIFSKSSEFMDLIKKNLFYGKELDLNRLKSILNEILDYIEIFCTQMNLDLNEIMEINVKKLEARYNKKFSEEQAVLRDIQKEREILASKSK